MKSKKQVSNGSGSCLIMCLKGFGILILISLLFGFGWIAGIVWLLFFRKKSNEDSKTIQRKTTIISILSVLSFIFMIFTFITRPFSESTIDNSNLVKQKQTTIEPIENSSFTNDILAENAKNSDNFPETSSESIHTTTETDLEIISRPGHPTYYGSVASSHIIWDDVPQNKIIFGDQNETFGEETILSMNAYKDSDLISSINICFSNFETSTNFTIEDVLPIVSSYMPFDIIKKYYHYEGSKLLVPDNDNKKRTKYYTISYGLTDEGHTAYYNGTHDYSGSIDIIITSNENDIIENFSITFGTPRWMSYLDQNQYHQETWTCNLTE